MQSERTGREDEQIEERRVERKDRKKSHRRGKERYREGKTKIEVIKY